MARTQEQRLAVLQTQLDQIDDRMTELTAQLAADTTEEGRSVALGSLLDQLGQARDKLLVAIAKSSGPVRVVSWGRAGH